MAYETIEFEIKEHVALITLNREEAANALNIQMADELMDAAIRCDTEKSVRAVLITARGKMFCAGGDLKVFSEAGNEVGVLAKKITTSLHAAVSRFARMAPLLVVAVNGTVAGGGLSLVLVADMVLSARSAKFTLAYTRAGLVPDGSSTYFMPRLIGLRRSQELMLTNRRLSADEAVEWGLINRVVSDEKLMEEAESLARDMASGATGAYGAVKKMLTETFTNPLETQMEIEARYISERATSPDGREGVDAFVKKRKPNFKGE